MIFGIDTVVNEWLSHGMPLPAPGGEGKLESRPTVTKLGLGCLILSSIFNITLREELLSSPKQNQIMHPCPDFMALVTWVKFLGEKLKATIPLIVLVWEAECSCLPRKMNAIALRASPCNLFRIRLTQFFTALTPPHSPKQQSMAFPSIYNDSIPPDDIHCQVCQSLLNED